MSKQTSGRLSISESQAGCRKAKVRQGVDKRNRQGVLKAVLKAVMLSRLRPPVFFPLSLPPPSLTRFLSCLPSLLSVTRPFLTPSLPLPPFRNRPERRGDVDAAVLGRLCALAGDGHAAPVRVGVGSSAPCRGQRSKRFPPPSPALFPLTVLRMRVVHVSPARCAASLTTTGPRSRTRSATTPRGPFSTPLSWCVA